MTNLNFLEYLFILKLKIYTVFKDILSLCQLHILLNRTAQISLELHFCVELHTKKPWHIHVHYFRGLLCGTILLLLLLLLLLL